MSTRRAGRRAVPAAVEAVRERIEHWRETREKRSPMPDALWDAAVVAAREHGTWAVSRALRVNYQSLRSRVDDQPGSGHGEASGTGGFVEFDGVEMLGAAEREATTLELWRPDGARLTIRLEGRETLDLPALAEAFWRSSG